MGTKQSKGPANTNGNESVNETQLASETKASPTTNGAAKEALPTKGGHTSHHFILKPKSTPDVTHGQASHHVMNRSSVEREQQLYQELLKHYDPKSAKSIMRHGIHDRHRHDMQVAPFSRGSNQSLDSQTVVESKTSYIPEILQQHSIRPPQLEELTLLDTLYVTEILEEMDVFSGLHASKKYAIVNSTGDNILYAAEDAHFCPTTRLRPFKIRIMDLGGSEIFHITRPLACTGFCFPCCRQKLFVHDSSGNLYGSIKQDWTLCKPRFTLRNAHGEAVLSIIGPVCPYRPLDFDKVDFYICTLDELKLDIGRISKYWTTMTLVTVDSAISFPGDIDVKIKAVLLGALFLIVSVVVL